MTTRRSSRNRFRCRAIIALGMLAAGCGDNPAGPGPDPDPDPTPTAADVDEYVESLGSWTDFAPPVATQDVAAPENTTVTEEAVQEPDAKGVIRPVIYQCTSVPHTLATTPQEIVMYEPNASMMWVGNLIQGKSYRDGQGSFKELSIRQRAPLKLSIDLLTGDNSAVVNDPSLTTVQSAIGELIERAHERGHRSGSSIVYREEVSYSVEQAALKLGLSARYLGVSAKAQLSRSRAANEHTLVAHFVQKMFTISMELPQSPEAVFSDDFTEALLQQQVNAGNIGRDNLPVYVASVTYGRTLTYTLTSTHSEERMRAAIAASYKGLAGGGGGFSEAELRETLSQQNIEVTAIGGEGQNVLDLISSGDLKSYFTTDAALTSARPLSYQLNFLGDNSTAKVGESTEYSLTTCIQKVVTPGRFDFLPVQQGSSPVPTPYQVYTGDFNGDGRGDLVWNHLVSGSNRVAIGFGRSDGGFDVRPAQVHPATPSGQWTDEYALVVADFDGDGSDDLLWNRPADGAPNALYLATSNGDGTLTFHDPVQHPVAPWAGGGWNVLAGDLDGDGDADLVWSRLTSLNQTYVARSDGTGGWEFGPQLERPGGWVPYTTYLFDVNGDQRDDIVWNVARNDLSNRTYVGLSKGDGTFDLLPYQDRGSRWSGYVTRTGDVNRDGRTDFIWVASERADIVIHRGLAGASGTFTFPDAQVHERPQTSGPLTTLIGDFNDDGSADILWNDLSESTNHVWVGLGNERGTFDFTTTSQEHPATEASDVDWTAFRQAVSVADVNGDGVDDVVWIDRAGTYRIYVALGRQPGV